MSAVEYNISIQQKRKAAKDYGRKRNTKISVRGQQGRLH